VNLPTEFRATDSHPLDYRVQEALEFMSAHVHESMTLWRLADHAGVSRDHLVRLFRRDTGMGPCAALKALRLRAAASLLSVASNLSIKEIAAKSGFGDRGHFSRDFKAVNGLSPTSYRRAAIQVRQCIR
jgi:transcriptional regulator GlxA family with amidase domain